MKHAYCVACGSTEHLTQHHLVPRSMGGNDEDSNLLTLLESEQQSRRDLEVRLLAAPKKKGKSK